MTESDEKLDNSMIYGSLPREYIEDFLWLGVNK